MDKITERIGVLHVDSESAATELVAEYLEKENERLSVTTATTVEDGLAVLTSEQIDCVVSDYNMPDRTGIDFLTAVRDSYGEVPFILYTGKGSESVASEAISAGVTDYLQKKASVDQYAVLANRIVNAVERRRAQRDRDRQLNAIESAQEGISILDEDEKFIYVNEAYAELYGYTPEEMLGEGWELLYQDKDVPRLRNEVLPTVDQRGHWKGKTTGLRADGSTFVEDHVLARTNSGGLVCTVRDITERQEREQELERTQDLMKQTEQIADVGGWELDTETMDIFWTEHLFDIMGISDETAPSLEEALEVYHEEDQAIVEEAVERALEDGEPFDVEVRFVRPNEGIRWLQTQGTPTIVDGEVVTLRGAVKDVTERRTREEVLREMYEIISDRKQSFEEQIRSLLELGRRELDTGYGTLSQIRDKEYLFEIVAGEDELIRQGEEVPVEATNCERVAETEKTVVLGDVERDASAETTRTGYTEMRICSYIGAPIYVGNDVYGTFCFYDTEPHTGQFSEWEQTLVDLMSRWASHELQRRQATEQLQAKNEQLEQFASIVSHDLRNPLNVASLRLELARDEQDNEHLQAVGQAHERMEQLIDDLLDLALEGEEVDETEPVALDAVVEHCQQNVDTRGATVELIDSATIEADHGRLQQLVENLVRNAIDHGGQDVKISVGVRPDGFYVEDTGPGIDANRHEEVFEPGYSTAEGGTGFGLSIVEQVSDAHGWDVQVTDGSGGGARFEMTGVEFVARE